MIHHHREISSSSLRFVRLIYSAGSMLEMKVSRCLSVFLAVAASVNDDLTQYGPDYFLVAVL